MLIGVEHLQGVIGETFWEKFWEAFFFSSQTITTVGYGRISPVGVLASSVAALESMIGLLAFAVATGLLYGRFSRPTAELVYSKKSLIAPYQDKTAWMFRIANARDNQLIEVEVQVVLSRIEPVEGGKAARRFYSLKLERSKVSFLSLSWTIVHPIDDESPLKGVTPEEFRESDTEFLVLIKAFDDTFSQTVHTRSSYNFDEVTWGAKFKPMFREDDGGKDVHLNLNRISECERAELPAEVTQAVS
jgi:inward rectifier potassium channel